MVIETLEGHLLASVTVEYCLDCQVFWFDRYESLQISPGSTLKLFRLIGEQATKGRPRVQTGARCPRCATRLLPTHDLQRNTPFSYWRCPEGHGRLITFYDFLREKDFIRPLSPQQLAELRRNLESVNCSNCGAPIDLANASSCAHCGSVLSILDMNQAERLIAQLQRADRRPTWDEAASSPAEQSSEDPVSALRSLSDPTWRADAASGGLVAAGLGALVRLLNKRIG